MPVQDLSKIRVAYKAQTGLDAPASGAGATGLEVTPSQGLQRAVQQIESALLLSSKMRRKPRHGSFGSSAAYETELMVGSIDPIIEAVLGGTWAPPLTLTETNVGSLTITDDGQTLTAGTGSWITEGAIVGTMARLTGMSEAANNGVWFPVLGVTATVLTVPAGYLVNNAVEAAFTIEFARRVHTAADYTERYFTVEEYLTTIDRSKLGTDAKWNQLSVQQSPNQMAQVSLGLGARDMDLLAPASSPNFTDPVFGAGDPLVLLDGGVYVNGTRRLDLTGLTFGLQAPVSDIPMVSTRKSPDVFLGQFAFAGQATGVVQDGDDFDDFDAETQLSVLARFQERGGGDSDFISFYMGDLSFGGWDAGAGGEGGMIKTLPLLGGQDLRGGVHAATTMLVSTSHVPV